MKRARRLVMIAGSIYLGIIVVLTLLETTLMYPAPGADTGDWNPSWLQFEEANITTPFGNQVHGWFCEHPNPKAVVLMCHGNGEHVAYMAEELDDIRQRYQVSVMAFDYRGYGKSPGKPFEGGILADAQAARAWLAERAQVESEDIVVWGRSLGGAVAVHLAAEGGARGLLLDRTFCSMVDVAASHYPWLPVRWLLRNRYPSQVWIQGYHGPLLQIHGKPDRVVPFRFGKRLFDMAPSTKKQFYASETLFHNDPWPNEIYQAVGTFLDSL